MTEILELLHGRVLDQLPTLIEAQKDRRLQVRLPEFLARVVEEIARDKDWDTSTALRHLIACGLRGYLRGGGHG